jgi:hypothetical protein
MPTNEQAVYTQGSGTPRGALAFYDFGAASNGSFDPSRGTFTETLTSFANDFGVGGTMAVRLRLAPSIANLSS